MFITVNNTLPIFVRTLRPPVVSGGARPSGICVGDFQPNADLTERYQLELSTQFINALNRHRCTDFVTNLNHPAFGQAIGSSLGRIVTLALKLRF